MEEFKQSKLSKMEWISIEKKLDKKELIIMNIIKNGYYNVDIQHNTHLTLQHRIRLTYIRLRFMRRWFGRYGEDVPVNDKQTHN